MKKLGMFLAVVCISILTSMIVFAGQWEQNDTGWWYEKIPMEDVRIMNTMR